MNWSRILIAGVVAGLVRLLYEFVVHGMIMAPTYARYPEVFGQEEVSVFWFLLLAVLIATVMASIYAKTNKSWGSGWKGGLAFGFCLGWLFFFLSFYNSIVFAGFPYFLSWCWGGIDLIDSVITGAVIGALYKS